MVSKPTRRVTMRPLTTAPASPRGAGRRTARASCRRGWHAAARALKPSGGDATRDERLRVVALPDVLRDELGQVGDGPDAIDLALGDHDRERALEVDHELEEVE